MGNNPVSLRDWNGGLTGEDPVTYYGGTLPVFEVVAKNGSGIPSIPATGVVDNLSSGLLDLAQFSSREAELHSFWEEVKFASPTRIVEILNTCDYTIWSLKMILLVK